MFLIRRGGRIARIFPRKAADKGAAIKAGDTPRARSPFIGGELMKTITRIRNTSRPGRPRWRPGLAGVSTGGRGEWREWREWREWVAFPVQRVLAKSEVNTRGCWWRGVLRIISNALRGSSRLTRNRGGGNVLSGALPLSVLWMKRFLLYLIYARFIYTYTSYPVPWALPRPFSLFPGILKLSFRLAIPFNSATGWNATLSPSFPRVNLFVTFCTVWYYVMKIRIFFPFHTVRNFIRGGGGGMLTETGILCILNS